MTNKHRTASKGHNVAVRRGLWIVGLIVAAGIGIAGFSLASSLLVA